MNIWQFAFSLIRLINEGKKWQRQNIVVDSDKNKFPFSFLQSIGLILAALFVYKNPNGVSDTEIDFLLSSLSIITGFFFAVIFLSFEQFKNIKAPDDSVSDEDKIKAIKSKNFLKKYNALSCYAILLSVSVIIMLIGTLLYGKHTNIMVDFIAANSFYDTDWLRTIKFYTLLLWRFSMIYFLFDFFIITIYAICSLFQFINLQMLNQDIRYNINKDHALSDYRLYKKEYGCSGIVAMLIIIVIVTSLLGFLLL